MHTDILAYHAPFTPEEQAICSRLAELIKQYLPTATVKIWHAHPVWFIQGNPIVGYSKLKHGIRLMFWSGQSFDEPALKQEGKFKAATFNCTSIEVIKATDMQRWLQKAVEIQWDYKNLVKRKGVLERLV